MGLGTLLWLVVDRQFDSGVQSGYSQRCRDLRRHATEHQTASQLSQPRAGAVEHTGSDGAELGDAGEIDDKRAVTRANQAAQYLAQVLSCVRGDRAGEPDVGGHVIAGDVERQTLHVPAPLSGRAVPSKARPYNVNAYLTS